MEGGKGGKEEEGDREKEGGREEKGREREGETSVFVCFALIVNLAFSLVPAGSCH